MFQLFRSYVSASSPLVGFGELNDNTIKGLTSLLSVEQEIEFIAYTCGLWNKKCIQVQQEGKLDDMPHSVVMKAKLYIVVLKDYENNLVQAKDNNANGINEIAFMLWDIIASYESKHIWQMANET